MFKKFKVESIAKIFKKFLKKFFDFFHEAKQRLKRNLARFSQWSLHHINNDLVELNFDFEINVCVFKTFFRLKLETVVCNAAYKNSRFKERFLTYESFYVLK